MTWKIFLGAEFGRPYRYTGFENPLDTSRNFNKRNHQMTTFQNNVSTLVPLCEDNLFGCDCAFQSDRPELLFEFFVWRSARCCWKKPFFKTWVTALSGALCVVCRKEDHLSQFLTTSVCNQYFYEALILSLSTGIFLLREYLNDFLSHLFRMIVFVIFLFWF